MSCTAYIVNTFHISLHHANFGQFEAKQVLYTIRLCIIFTFTKSYLGDPTAPDTGHSLRLVDGPLGTLS